MEIEIDNEDFEDMEISFDEEENMEVEDLKMEDMIRQL
jgi:hypothetical protein